MDPCLLAETRDCSCVLPLDEKYNGLLLNSSYLFHKIY
jgi:hypothetical protein